MGFEPSEDKSDPMEAPQGDEELGIGRSASKNHSPRCVMGQNHILLEIFAVQFSEKEDPLDQILDENLILATRHNRSEYILYDVSGDKNIKTNSEGHLILQWPDRSIEIKDLVSIRPCYDPISDIKMSQTLWSRSCMYECFDRTDCFMHQYVETRNSFIEINFAVYTDGLEAKIDVTLSDLELLGMPLAVYGTVTTSNSAITHPQAKSLLFDRTCKSDVILAHPPTCEAELSLPLSRSVTAIPRQSNLIVDIDLFVQDTSIANSSVIFHAKTRSNTIAEEQLIVGNHGNVKVKVTWMEAVDDGGSAKEEEDGGSSKEVEDRLVQEWVEEDTDVENEGHEESESRFVSDDDDSFRSLKSQRLKTQEDISTRNYGQSAKEEEDGESAKEVEDGRWEEEEENDVENGGDEESESEFVSDDSSFRSLKSRRLNTQEVISTRSYDYTMKEDVVMENKDGDQEASLDSNPRLRYKESFLEVFSVKIVGPENVRLDEIYGFIMIDAPSSPRLLFGRVRGDPPKINSQGFLLLEGPRRLAWCVCDEVLIVPFLFKYQNFNFVNEKNCAHYLWHNSEYDKVFCKTFDNEVGDIEVNFAVYKDGVEAHLNIMLIDSLFSSSEVYGTITATNSKFKDPRASSIVFEKEELKHVEGCVWSGEEVALPLSRPIIALPVGSTLGLDFNIYARRKPVVVLPVEFPVQLGTSEKILSANGCSVKIEVDFFVGFFDKKPRELENYEGYF